MRCIADKFNKPIMMFTNREGRDIKTIVETIDAFRYQGCNGVIMSSKPVDEASNKAHFGVLYATLKSHYAGTPTSIKYKTYKPRNASENEVSFQFDVTFLKKKRNWCIGFEV